MMKEDAGCWELRAAAGIIMTGKIGYREYLRQIKKRSSSALLVIVKMNQAQGYVLIVERFWSRLLLR
jgi:hypothetical protein